MGLGKTLQTLSFLAALKDAGLPGPHLVVTPLAVVQNWANELRRFTPQVTWVLTRERFILFVCTFLAVNVCLCACVCWYWALFFLLVNQPLL